LLSLGFAYSNIADAGATLATIERIPDGDGEAWVTQWTATADRVAALAEESASGGHEQDGNLQARCESERREKSPDECALNAPF